MTTKPDFEKLRRDAIEWIYGIECDNRHRASDARASNNGGVLGGPMWEQVEMRATMEMKSAVKAIEVIERDYDARIAAEARVAKLERQLAVAVACLSEFADENNYHEGFCDYVTYSINGHSGYPYTECDLDSSDAKKALTKIKEIDNE